MQTGPQYAGTAEAVATQQMEGSGNNVRHTGGYRGNRTLQGILP